MVHLRRELFPNAFCFIWVHLLVEVHADSVSKSWRWLTIISWSTKHPLTHSAPSSASASLADQHLAFTINNISSPLPPWISSISCSSLLVLVIFNIVANATLLTRSPLFATICAHTRQSGTSVLTGFISKIPCWNLESPWSSLSKCIIVDTKSFVWGH